MQPVVTRLRSRHRSSAVLKALVRLADPAVSVTVHAHSEQAGRSLCLDQRFAPSFIKADLRIRLVSGGSAKLNCHVPSGRLFSSSAEFSAGSFKVSATPGEDRQDEEPADDIDDKAMLLEASLSFVGDKGWTDAALIAGAKHLGLSPAIIGILPRGPAELVEYFEHECNEELASQLQNNKEAWQGLRMTQRVKEGLKLRLQMNAPYIDTWAQAISIRSQPRNVSVTLQQLAQITDDVWHAAGDKSTDYNWYTKRGLLAGVYTATELYMLTDYSPEFADTWDVLDRRLRDVMTISKLLGQMGTSASSFMAQVGNTFSPKLPRNHAQYSETPPSV